MKYTYEIVENLSNNKTIVRSDGACIPFDEANSDYQQYLKDTQADA